VPASPASPDANHRVNLGIVVDDHNVSGRPASAAPAARAAATRTARAPHTGPVHAQGNTIIGPSGSQTWHAPRRAGIAPARPSA